LSRRMGDGCGLSWRVLAGERDGKFSYLGFILWDRGALTRSVGCSWWVEQYNERVCFCVLGPEAVP